ncbi:hypothetical protein [Halobellus ordinarius]|uniref:hypothetical protein n=1 Tax=Halobellus ordinarius TaxID=3075120 RepID=UPI0028806678|nr:hypothetical protein [Halobellus sp. ZY16]
MVEPSSLAAATSVISKASELSDHIEYWKQFAGEEIDVRTAEVARSYRDSGDEYIETVIIIRGTVTDVLSNPAGFLLSDVEEILRTRKLQRSYSTAGYSETMTLESPDRNLRRVDEKFVAFSDINQLELTEVAEDADEEVEDSGEGGWQRD